MSSRADFVFMHGLSIGLDLSIVLVAGCFGVNEDWIETSRMGIEDLAIGIS